MARKPKIDTDKIANLIKSTPEALDLLTKLGVAFLGAHATKHPAGAIIGLVGLKLAQSENLIAGASGVATLGGLGLATVIEGGGIKIGTPLTGNTLGKDLIETIQRAFGASPFKAIGSK